MRSATRGFLRSGAKCCWELAGFCTGGGAAATLGGGGVPTRTDMSGGGRDFAITEGGAFSRRFISDGTCGACVLCATETGGWGPGA